MSDCRKVFFLRAPDSIRLFGFFFASLRIPIFNMCFAQQVIFSFKKKLREKDIECKIFLSAGISLLVQFQVGTK